MVNFHPSGMTKQELVLREEVRAFLAEEFPSGQYLPELGINAVADPAFSRKLAQRGWLGMVVPKAYGGPGRTAVERYVVAEELLVAGAPLGAHWSTDRQTAPTLLSFGSEFLKQRFLPAIVQGTTFFALGMSEPESGSDLVSVRTRATRVDGGWRINGLKTWTTAAHTAHYAVVLCRTAEPTANKYEGLSQLIVDLHGPGVTVSPINILTGRHHFNEILMDDEFVPDDMVLGDVGAGWSQVTAELAYERSGPDRYLSTFPLVRQFLDDRAADGAVEAEAIGRIVARYWTLRNLSLAVARALDAGEVPAAEAAMLKDIGTVFEQDVVEIIRDLTDTEQDPDAGIFGELLAEATLTSPTLTLRGGTNEVLRSVAAKTMLRQNRRHS